VGDGGPAISPSFGKPGRMFQTVPFLPAGASSASSLRFSSASLRAAHVSKRSAAPLRGPAIVGHWKPAASTHSGEPSRAQERKLARQIQGCPRAFAGPAPSSGPRQAPKAGQCRTISPVSHPRSRAQTVHWRRESFAPGRRSTPWRGSAPDRRAGGAFRPGASASAAGRPGCSRGPAY